MLWLRRRRLLALPDASPRLGPVTRASWPQVALVVPKNGSQHACCKGYKNYVLLPPRRLSHPDEAQTCLNRCFAGASDARTRWRRPHDGFSNEGAGGVHLAEVDRNGARPGAWDDLHLRTYISRPTSEVRTCGLSACPKSRGSTIATSIAVALEAGTARIARSFSSGERLGPTKTVRERVVELSSRLCLALQGCLPNVFPVSEEALVFPEPNRRLSPRNQLQSPCLQAGDPESPGSGPGTTHPTACATPGPASTWHGVHPSSGSRTKAGGRQPSCCSTSTGTSCPASLGNSPMLSRRTRTAPMRPPHRSTILRERAFRVKPETSRGSPRRSIPTPPPDPRSCT